MKVFISSTYKDLIDYRAAAIRAVEGTNYQASKMEVFGARPDEPLDACLKEVEESDLFIGIYALRYGFIPEGADISITEMEYLHAKKLGKPIYCFILDEENQPWLQKWVEDEPGKSKLVDLKKRLQKVHVCDYFTTPDDLRAKVSNALSHYVANRLEPNSQSSTQPAKPTGSTLPYQPYFFGRERELAIIADAISPASRTWGALIDGPGGIGKTALAIRAAHLASTSLFERKIFITAKVRELTPEGEKPLIDFSHDSYFSIISELALELGIDGIILYPPDERADQLRLALAGKKTLIVIDNLETLSEIERTRLFQFLNHLPDGNKAIVTSRRRTDIDARVIRLDRLSATNALELIEELAKNRPRLARENIEARKNLYEITYGNPLLIKWVCGQLGRPGSAMRTIDDAYEFISNAPKDNDPLEYIFGDLLVSCSIHETKVLAALTHFTYPAKLDWIVKVTNLPTQITITALDDLNDRSILASNHENREFYLTPITRHFIRSKRQNIVNETGEILVEAVHSLLTQYSHDATNETDKLESNYSFISASIPLLLSGENNRLQDICNILTNFLNEAGHWDDLLSLSEEAEQVALSANDKRNAGWRAYWAGWVYNLRGESVGTLACASKVVEYWKDFGPFEKATAYRLLGRGYRWEKNYSAAITEYQKALNLYKTISPESIEVAQTLSDLASGEVLIKDFRSAKVYYHEALKIAEKNENKVVISAINGLLAELALRQEKWEDAEKLSKEALSLSEAIEANLQIGLNSLRLAKALARRDLELIDDQNIHQINIQRIKDAIPNAKKAVEIFTKLRYMDQFESQNLLTFLEQAVINYNQNKRY